MKTKIYLRILTLAAVFCLFSVVFSFSAQAKQNPGGVYIFADSYCDDRDINAHLFLSLDKETSFSVDTVRNDGYYPSGTAVNEYKNGSLTDKYFYILPADINCDGVIDILDVTVFELYLGGGCAFDFANAASSDINRDGVSDVEDFSQTVNLALSNGAYFEDVFRPEGINTTDYTPAEIAENKYTFAIGKTKPEYAVAKFNSSYSSVTISANGFFSDGKTADFESGESPLEQHAATLKTVIIENGITQIGARLCRNCTKIEKIELPPTCRDVGTRAFYNNTAAKALNLGKVRTIGTAAFADCANLACKLTVPDTCRFIGDYAFAALNCKQMNFNALTLGKSVEYIGAGAFQCCSYMTNELVLPETLEVIGDFAFNHCTSLSNTVLKIPASVKHIGGNTVNHALFGTRTQTITFDNYKEFAYTDSGTHIFYNLGAYKLKAFDVDEQNENFKSADGVLYSKDGKRLLCVPPNYGSTFVMPEGVVNADEMSMFGVTDLTLANSFIIMPWQNAARTQINFQNSLTDALYYNSMICKVHLKAGNRHYTESNGCIYSADAKKTLLHLYIEPGKTLNILSGCTAIDGVIIYDERVKAKIGGAVINIPPSVGNITNNNSENYPDEGELDGLNKYIADGTLTVKVNAANAYLKNTKDGKVSYR